MSKNWTCATPKSVLPYVTSYPSPDCSSTTVDPLGGPLAGIICQMPMINISSDLRLGSMDEQTLIQELRRTNQNLAKALERLESNAAKIESNAEKIEANAAAIQANSQLIGTVIEQLDKRRD